MLEKIPALDPRVISMALSDSKVRKLSAGVKDKKYPDGEGLYLLVTSKGSKLWRMRYRFQGREKTLSFGKYPYISLADARDRRAWAKKQLASGQDPRVLEKQQKAEGQSASANTFALIADELLEKLRKEGKSEATLKKKAWFLNIAENDFGDLPIKDVTPSIVLQTLKRVEKAGTHEKANRLRATIGQVCRYAVQTARAENDPTYALRGALISPRVQHMPAIVERSKFEELIRSLWKYDGAASTTAALKLLAVLYPRPGELRLAKWSEFDFGKRCWTVPSEREKNRRDHVKPLSDLAINILNEQRAVSGYGEFVFPSPSNPRKPLSENAIPQALHRMDYKGLHTGHGFRASASSLLNESGRWNEDAIEAELGHLGSNHVRRAYHRARYWDERVQMADWWASEIEAVVMRT
ncbi:MAG: integrase arm-type DNA-binding domain-containing protein [Pseudomonadota bacterium]